MLLISCPRLCLFSLMMLSGKLHLRLASYFSPWLETSLFERYLQFLSFYYCMVALFVSIYNVRFLVHLQNEGSTLYPNEADDLFGDPLLFKVMKKKKEGSPGVMEYEVIGVLNRPSLLNIFYYPDHPAYGGPQTDVSAPVLGEAVAAGGCVGRPPNVRGAGMLGTVGGGVVSLCGAKARGVKRSRDEASVCVENGDGFLPSKTGRFAED